MKLFVSYKKKFSHMYIANMLFISAATERTCLKEKFGDSQAYDLITISQNIFLFDFINYFSIFVV